jgi:hypothetical protein
VAPTLLRQWMEEIIRVVCNKYAVATQELVSSVKKMEQMLKKLGTSSAAGTTPTTTGSDKIFAQISIDVKNFVEGVSSLGVVSGEFGPLTELTGLTQQEPQASPE